MVMLTLWLPHLNSVKPFLPDMPLEGSYDKAARPEFTSETWFEGTFQSNAEKWLNENFSTRDLLIRLRNQYYYSVFRIAMANGVAIGKEGVLFEQGYIDAFYGKDFAGEEFLSDKLTRWKRVEKGLDSIGVKAFLALAPGKASYFEDSFSERIKDYHRPLTNYQFIEQHCNVHGIRCLDLKKLFHLWNDTSQYPLFPKYGTHWSFYGAAHAIDTVRGYIQHMTNRRLPEFSFDIEMSDEARDTDNDIGRGMNLLFIPKKERLAYPIRYFSVDSTLEPTKLLVIADSYYYTFITSGFADRVVSYGGFWFYFKVAEPHHMFSSSVVEELNILEELKKQDAVMLMMTEPQLGRFGWGAVEKLEEVLYPKSENP